MVRIEPPIPTTLNPTRQLGPNALLPVGRVLDAVVIQQRAGQLYELNAGPLRLLAESQQPLRPGEQLLLRVTGRDAAQRPTLEVVPPSTAATTPFLKTVLPLQQEPTKLLAALWQLSQVKPEHPLLQRATQLIEQLPTRQQLSEPNALQRTLLNSGLFLEPQLQSGQPVADTDLKAALLKLLRALHGQQSQAQSSAAPAKTAESAAQKPSPPASATPPGKAETAQEGQRAPTAGSGDRPAADTYTRPAAAPPQPAGRTLAPSPPPTATTAATTPPSAGQQGPAAGQNVPTTQQPMQAVHIREALPGQVNALPRAEPPPAADLANIGKLIGQLARHAESTLARIEAHQLLHLQSHDSNTAQWLLEIPVRDRDGVDVWQLHIAREDKDSHSADTPPERAWHITLSFDFPNTGAVITRVEYTQEKTVITFYAESAETDELIGEQTASFKELLEEKGINSVMIVHHQGLPHRDILPSALHSVLEDQA